MGRRKTPQEKRSIFFALTRNKSKQEIERIENRLNRKLRREERRKIIQKNASKARRKVAISAIIFALGGVTGASTQKLLNEGKTELSIDAEKYTDGIDIKNVTNDREVFINGLRVELNEIDVNENLEEMVKEEINNFKTSEDVSEYSKRIYEEAYLDQCGEDIKVTDINKNYIDTNNSSELTIWAKRSEEETPKIIEKVERNLEKVESKSGKDVLLEDNKVVYDIIALGREYARSLDDKEIGENNQRYAKEMESEWKNDYLKSVLEYKMRQKDKSIQNNNEVIQEDDGRI